MSFIVNRFPPIPAHVLDDIIAVRDNYPYTNYKSNVPPQRWRIIRGFIAPFGFALHIHDGIVQHEIHRHCGTLREHSVFNCGLLQVTYDFVGKQLKYYRA